MSNDPHRLQRFLDAQKTAYADALAELRKGRKTSHWMWFVFPQLAGLGRSATAQYYGIASLDEAQAYLAHPLLSERLRACIETLQTLPAGRSAAGVVGVVGEVDAMKLRSSLTLFEAAGGGDLYGAALRRWFGGERDGATLGLLDRSARR